MFFQGIRRFFEKIQGLAEARRTRYFDPSQQEEGHPCTKVYKRFNQAGPLF